MTCFDQATYSWSCLIGEEIVPSAPPSSPKTHFYHADQRAKLICETGFALRLPEPAAEAPISLGKSVVGERGDAKSGARMVRKMAYEAGRGAPFARPETPTLAFAKPGDTSALRLWDLARLLPLAVPRHALDRDSSKLHPPPRTGRGPSLMQMAG